MVIMPEKFADLCGAENEIHDSVEEFVGGRFPGRDAQVCGSHARRHFATRGAGGILSEIRVGEGSGLC